MNGREIKKNRELSLEGKGFKNNVIFQEDINDKENLVGRANFKDIQHGLQSGNIGYDDLKFDKSLLEGIDFEQDKQVKKRASKSRSKSRTRLRSQSNSRAIKQKSRSRNAVKRTSKQRVSKMR